MKSKTLYSSILSASIAAVLLGCGGGGSSSGGGGTNPVVAKEGRAVDGPLAGALVVFEDCNRQSVETNQEGFFEFPTNCSASALTVTGGIDRATNLPFTATLKAPRSSSNEVIVSPITTLIQVQVEKGIDVNTASQQIAQALGLTGTNLLSADPMQNQELYTKTVVVQQLVEQIKHSIAPLGDAIPEEEFTLATFAALTAALTSTTSISNLQDPAIIQATITQTLTSIQEHLEPAYQNNLAAVSANLAALATPAILSNVKAVESTLQSLPASTFNQGVDAIQQSTQNEIQAAKDSVVTNKLVSSLAEVLVLPANVASSVLAEIGAATLDSNSENTLAAPFEELLALVDEYEIETAIDPETLLNELVNIDAFYADYLKLADFSILNQRYTIKDFNASLQSPINLTALDGLTLGLESFGNLRNQTIQVSAGLKISTLSNKQVSIAVDRLNLGFNSNGTLQTASLPSGTQLRLESNLNSVRAANLTLNNATNVLQNGKVALNGSVLGQISSQLSGLANLPLKGETVTLTAVIDHPQIHIANDNTEQKPVLSHKYQLNSNSFGSGVSAKFKIAP